MSELTLWEGSSAFVAGSTTPSYQQFMTTAGFAELADLSALAGLPAWMEEHSHQIGQLEETLAEEFKKPIPRDPIQEFRDQLGCAYGEQLPQGQWALGVIAQPAPGEATTVSRLDYLFGGSIPTGINILYGVEIEDNDHAVLGLPLEACTTYADEKMFVDPATLRLLVPDTHLEHSYFSKMSERASQEMMIVAGRVVGLTLKDAALTPPPLPYDKEEVAAVPESASESEGPSFFSKFFGKAY